MARALLGLFVSFLFCLNSARAAVVVDFECISTNTPSNCAALAAQVTTVITLIDDHRAAFRFENEGSVASSITDIYFEATLSPFSITNGGLNVSFVAGASPSNLLNGGEASPPFVATLSLESTSPVQANGVGPGEFVIATLFSPTMLTEENILASLSVGDLRLGFRAQGFPNGGSESAVNVLSQSTQTIVEPATIALFVPCVAGLFAWRRSRASPLLFGIIRSDCMPSIATA